MTISVAGGMYTS